jgi:8-oxo-dGTP pyrophosphatase MutT (NUDIX family)
MPDEKWTSAGGVVLASKEQPDKVWVVKPSNNYGPWCFPKGKIDKGESHEQAALREVLEEAGVTAHILPGGYLGSGSGTHSITHYYMMIASGPPGPHDHETEEVRLVTFEEAHALFTGDVNNRDITILKKAIAWIETNL